MVTIAHRSGGPAADIVVPLPDHRISGFLAETPEEYAEAMARVFGSTAVAASGKKRKANDELQAEDGHSACGSSESEGGRTTVEGPRVGASNFSSLAVRVAGRESARRFSNEVFDRKFAAEFAELLPPAAPSAFALRRERKEK